MTENSLGHLLGRLRRYPDVEAPNLQAWDATDKLLLETAADFLTPESSVAVLGDRYGALTLGLLAGRASPPARVRVHQDLITGERALRQQRCCTRHRRRVCAAAPGGSAAGRRGHRPAAAAQDAGRAGGNRRRRGPVRGRRDVVLLAGGRVKHMSLGMNAVLERYFETVQPQLARQKSRLLAGSGAKPGAASVAVSGDGAQRRAGPARLCARRRLRRHQAGHRHPVPAGLPAGDAAARHAVDLGCGTGILAAMYARSTPRRPRSRPRTSPRPPSPPPWPPPGPTAWTAGSPCCRTTP